MQKVWKTVLSKNHLTIKIMITIFTVLVAIAIVVLHSTYATTKEVQEQIQQNLADVARQNAAIVESKIQQQYQLLQSLSKELDGVTPETIDEKLDHFKIFMEPFHLKRFAFCFPDGTTYSTDGTPTNLSYRNFYQAGMEGDCYITEILSDAIQNDESQINIMTIPIFDKTGAVGGVFGFAYDTEAFNASLQIDSFEGEGYSCIVNENNEIMASMGDHELALSSNIITDILQNDTRNESIIQYLQESSQKNKEANGVIYLSEKSYYHCIPIELMDHSITWYIYTIVPTKVLNQRISPIQHNQFTTSISVMILICVGAVLIMLFRKEQRKQMMRYAYEDSVTHGANYAKFCLEMEKQHHTKGYLVAMDIANFNDISIVAGEEAGDIMIKEAWKIINRSLKHEELAGHVRDDMFLLFLKVANGDALLQRMTKISEKISEKAADFQVYGIQARYGIFSMTGEDTLENAYSKAKLAREYAVVKLGLHYAFYNEVNRAKMQHEKELESRFKTALTEHEFKVWYQPKYSASDCTIVGSEALVRWQKKSGEMISPGEFIPLFERNGMIVKLDEYMFRTVCQQQRQWMDAGMSVFPVSINISRASLYSKDIEKRYQQIMTEYQMEPQYIQLEVTETIMDKKADIRELLNKFRNMGIKILMDDFGTGYSSFATLSSQCFDTLKLDKTLIDHIGNKDGETMLYHIIRMGQQMGLHITAEGVEKQTQLAFLQNLKCDDIQGFYFSKPVPTDAYEKLILKNTV